MQCCFFSTVILLLRENDECFYPQILGDEDKRTRYDSGEDIDDNGMGMGGGGFNPFGGGGQQFTFHFEGGFPGGGFPGGFHF